MSSIAITQNNHGRGEVVREHVAGNKRLGASAVAGPSAVGVGASANAPGIVLPLQFVLTGILALILAVTLPRPCGTTALFRNCAWVLALPIWCLLLAHSIAARQLAWYFAKYGMFALFFGVASYGVDLLAFAAQFTRHSAAPPVPAREAPV